MKLFTRTALPFKAAMWILTLRYAIKMYAVRNTRLSMWHKSKILQVMIIILKVFFNAKFFEGKYTEIFYIVFMSKLLASCIHINLKIFQLHNCGCLCSSSCKNMAEVWGAVTLTGNRLTISLLAENSWLCSNTVDYRFHSVVCKSCAELQVKSHSKNRQALVTHAPPCKTAILLKVWFL